MLYGKHIMLGASSLALAIAMPFACYARAPKPAAATEGDSGSAGQSMAPAGETDLRLPPGNPSVSHEQVHEALLGLEDTLNNNARASTGAMSFVGSEIIALPENVAAVLTDGFYRAEQGVWVLQVYGGKVVSAVKQDMKNLYEEAKVTVQPASDPAARDAQQDAGGDQGDGTQKTGAQEDGSGEQGAGNPANGGADFLKS